MKNYPSDDTLSLRHALRPAHRQARRRQRGATLLESLAAFVVLSLGMLAVARVQVQLRDDADTARHRSEAVRLGQEEMEDLRAFSVMTAASGARGYAGISSGSRTVDGASGLPTNTRFTVARDIDSGSMAQAKAATVTVNWADLSGATQQVALHSLISGSDPAYSGAPAIAPAAGPRRSAFARSVAIPVGAKDMGNGSGAFKPVASGSLAFVFDNASGRVSMRCTGLNAATQTRDLAAADLTHCTAVSAYLLSGTVRFASSSAAPAADPAQARDMPLAFAVALTLSGGSYASAPACATEAMKTVSYTDAGGAHVEAVPIAAVPASLGVGDWVESGDRFSTYHCAVYPLASGAWSGRSSLVPSGWSVGTGPNAWRVCRYAADLDGSGAVDANIEHPASYSAVTGSLANQNFLVVSGAAPCPTAPPVAIGGQAPDVFANLSTVQQQP